MFFFQGVAIRFCKEVFLNSLRAECFLLLEQSLVYGLALLTAQSHVLRALHVCTEGQVVWHVLKQGWAIFYIAMQFSSDWQKSELVIGAFKTLSFLCRRNMSCSLGALLKEPCQYVGRLSTSLRQESNLTYQYQMAASHIDFTYYGNIFAMIAF